MPYRGEIQNPTKEIPLISQEFFKNSSSCNETHTVEAAHVDDLKKFRSGMEYRRHVGADGVEKEGWTWPEDMCSKSYKVIFPLMDINQERTIYTEGQIGSSVFNPASGPTLNERVQTTDDQVKAIDDRVKHIEEKLGIRI